MSIVARYSTGEVSQPFWEALAGGRLVLPSCRSCKAVFFFPRRWCPECWSDDLTWIAATGTGIVYASTEVHVPFQGINEADLPLTVVLVDLDEGPRLAGKAAPGAAGLRIGDRVRVQFAATPSEQLPSFVAQP